MLLQLEKSGIVTSYPNLKNFKDSTKSVKQKFIKMFGKNLIDDTYNFIEKQAM